MALLGCGDQKPTLLPTQASGAGGYGNACCHGHHYTDRKSRQLMNTPKPTARPTGKP